MPFRKKRRKGYGGKILTEKELGNCTGKISTEQSDIVEKKKTQEQLICTKIERARLKSTSGSVPDSHFGSSPISISSSNSALG